MLVQPILCGGVVVWRREKYKIQPLNYTTSASTRGAWGEAGEAGRREDKRRARGGESGTARTTTAHAHERRRSEGEGANNTTLQRYSAQDEPENETNTPS